MAYKWKPSKAQRREFAVNMQNPEYAAAYHARKEERATKRRTTSKFGYAGAGGSYIPTQAQHDFCLQNIHLFCSVEEKTAANTVMFGYSCSEAVHHDCIHIVNEKIRSQSFC